MRRGDTRRAGLLGSVLQSYFCEYLINQRRLSPRTVESYRDTFRLLLTFLESERNQKPDDLRLIDLDSDCVLDFLDHLERTRRNSARTRNARLAALRSFYRFALARDPLLLPIAQRVLAIPSKRFERGAVSYLTPAQVQALIDAPDASSRTGLRDRVLLTLLYNTGARVSEIAALQVSDLRLEGGVAAVHLRGKGRKDRQVPLWRESVLIVRRWLKQTNSAPDAPLLPNSRGGHMSRSGIEQRLKVGLQLAVEKDPALKRLRLSPHVIRHTTAMHLLQSGVDLSVISLWLGHESLDTTHKYLDADLERKKRALDYLSPPKLRRSTEKKRQRLVEFLRRL